jgi:hypothetical protein
MYLLLTKASYQKMDNIPNYKIHSESWYWFCSSVFHAEADNLNISSRL